MLRVLLTILISALLSYSSWYVHPFFSFTKFIPLLYVVALQAKWWQKLPFIFLFFLVDNIVTAHWLMQYEVFKAVLLYVVISLLYTLPILLPVWIEQKRKHFGLFMIPLIIGLTDLLHPYLTLNTTLFATGYIFAKQPQYIQWYQYTGGVGGTIWIVFLNVFLFWTIKERLIRKYAVVVLLILFCVPVLSSRYMFSKKANSSEVIKAAYVHTDTIHHVAAIEKLCDSNAVKADFLLLPEGFLYNDVMHRYDKKFTVKKMLAKIKRQIPCVITGATVEIFQDDGNLYQSIAGKDYPYRRYNAAIGYTMNETQIKVKKVLIPFDEYMPHYFEFLNKYMENEPMRLSTDEGNGDIIKVKDTKAFVLVCYEIAHSSFIAERIQNDNGFMTLLTSEDFMANTDGLDRYMDIIRVKAIEFQKFIVKSSYKGIAACIDNRGVVLKVSGTSETELLTSDVPCVYGRTLFCSVEYLIKYILAVAVLVIVSLAVWLPIVK